MRKFIKRYIRKNCGECEIVQDVHGNVFVTKGDADSYPCLASHIDQVQHKHSKDFEIVEGKDVVFGYSAKSREQQGLGADDKNGIWICLECLREFSALKVAFFVGEEVGCVGSSSCDLKFFSDCRYVIEPDRMHGHDLITSMSVGAVCSDEFAKALCAEQYGYKEAHGSITDVGELVERGVGISCLNLSCGYYQAHTSEEFTVLSELQNCLNFVCHVIDTLTEKVYPFEYVGWYSGYQSYYPYKGFYDYYGNGCSRLSKSDFKKGKNKNQKKTTYYDYGYESDYYDMCYDDDLAMMYELVASNPNLTFDDVVGTGGWIGNFYTRDIDLLREMYDDACEIYRDDKKFSQYDESEFWDMEDDSIGEDFFSLDGKEKKVSA